MIQTQDRLVCMLRYELNKGRMVRDYENSAKKVVRYMSDLRFILHCKHNGGVLVSLHICTVGQGAKAEGIIKRAERDLY